MDADVTGVLVVLFIATQLLYLGAYAIEAYIFSLPVDRVDMRARTEVPGRKPFIVLLYPVLHELEATMRTTFEAIAAVDYPRDRFCVVAIPNAHDHDTIASLERMEKDYPFLAIRRVPPTSDPSWNAVWSAWNANPKAYWWHQGNRAHVRDLPAKKTRQLVWATYTLAEERAGTGEDWLLNYIDADSAPAPDHFLAGARGMERYDVLQSTNVAGNLNRSLAASWHAFDHMAWDGRKYPHLSAHGRHPYWVLGKGLFFRASDLVALGGFNPWITIEDPEVGMRFWKNGRRLGIIEAPLIEEVPERFGHGITQRKRWVAGFFQSLGAPLTAMGFTRAEKFRAWLNFLPCLSLWINPIGLPVGIWAGITWWQGTGVLPTWTLWLSALNIACYLVGMTGLYASTWRRTAQVLDRKRDRLLYMARVNPVFIWAFWLLWLVPLWIGWRMYRRDHGLTWERTEKIDANARLVRAKIAEDALIATVLPQKIATRT